MSEAGSANGEAPPEELEPFEPRVILTKPAIEAECLSKLYRVPSGSSYAFSNLTCEEKDPPIQELVDVNKYVEKEEEEGVKRYPNPTMGECPLTDYKFLRVLKLNINALTNIDSIVKLEYLLELQAKQNQLANIDVLAKDKDTLKFLQMVDLSQNQLQKLPHIQCPMLKKLILDENQIQTVELKSNGSVKVLSLNKNRLRSCEGFARLYECEQLSLQENVFEVEEPVEGGEEGQMEPKTYSITSFKGLEHLPKLRKLQLQGNKIEKLDDIPDLPELRELYLDGNGIATMDELKKLGTLKNLEVLSMGGNPVADEKGEEFKKEILILLMDELTNLRSVNENPITPEDIEEAKTAREERIKEAEEKRLAEEAAKAEADAAGADGAEAD